VRILFLTHYFPPEVNAPANRTYEHCRSWAAAGHEVHVVTCVPSHPIGEPFPGHRRGWYAHEKTDGIDVHRVWTHLAPNRGVFRRTVNYLSFVPTAVFRSWRLGSFDIIVGTSPQFFCALASYVAAFLRRTPWIFELRDLWPESICAVGAMQKSLALRLLERLELRMYRNASAVVCLTRAFMDNLGRRGVDPAKLKYVPNGIVPSFWESGSRDRGRAQLGLTADQIGVSYVGTIGMAHGLGTVLDAARLLGTSHPGIRFFVVGDGAELADLKARAASLGLSNVAFTGLLPRRDVTAIMAGTDLTLVTLKPADTFKTVLPSKMFEAMAARKPIVLAVEGEAKQVLERAHGGLCVPPGDGRALANAVATLAEDPALRIQLGNNGAEYVAREFNRAVWATRYLNILRNVSETKLASRWSLEAAPSQARHRSVMRRASSSISPPT
jgi:glycosyltransferase involved in cell wall biosynthesis